MRPLPISQAMDHPSSLQPVVSIAIEFNCLSDSIEEIHFWDRSSNYCPRICASFHT